MTVPTVPLSSAGSALDVTGIRALFPALPQAYEAWLGSRDSARLARVVKAAETHWLDAARQLTATYHRDPSQGDAQLNALAGGDLASLKR